MRNAFGIVPNHLTRGLLIDIISTHDIQNGILLKVLTGQGTKEVKSGFIEKKESTSRKKSHC